MPSKQPLIFLSYRRGDAQTALEELYSVLRNKYGEDGVFRDTSTIRAGTKYPPALRSKLHEADAVLLVIGPGWIREARHGELDWVVEEAALALKNPKTRIFPVLVDGARFPVDALPPRILGVKDWQSFSLRPAHFRADALRLLRALPQPVPDAAITVAHVGRLKKIDSRQQQTDGVSVLAWAPDGKALISGGEDGSVGWWKGQTVRSKPAHSSSVRHVAFASDRKWMFSLSCDALRVWTHPGGTLQEETKLSFDEGRTFSMAASPVDPIFVVGAIGKDPEIYTVPDAAWCDPLPDRSLSSRLRLRWPPPKPFLATALAFSPDGRVVAAGSLDGSVWLWTIADRTLLWKKRLAKTCVVALVFSPAGAHIASASDGQVCVYNLDGSALLQQEVDGPVKGVAFSPDGNLLACALEKGAMMFLDLAACSSVAGPLPRPTGALAVAISPDGTRLAVGLPNGVVELWGID